MKSFRSDGRPGATPSPVVQLVGIDAAWGALLGEWLREAGYRVAGAEGACTLVLLGLAFPRRDGPRQVQHMRQRWPAAALVLASPTFHHGVEAQGPLARELGVDAILAMPATRAALLNVLRQALASPP